MTYLQINIFNRDFNCIPALFLTVCRFIVNKERNNNKEIKKEIWQVHRVEFAYSFLVLNYTRRSEDINCISIRNNLISDCGDLNRARERLVIGAKNCLQRYCTKLEQVVFYTFVSPKILLRFVSSVDYSLHGLLHCTCTRFIRAIQVTIT
jgi:hypothetical protein